MQISKKNTEKFQKFILNYFQRHGRHDLPWRQDYDPYTVMVSEIMLQQTQVDRVIPKFIAFLKVFPNVKTLANATLADVLKQWQCLGYNRRGKYLHLTAQEIVKKFNGVVPSTKEELISLPGIGEYTAAAIQAFSFNQPVIIIETNVRAIYLHHFFPERGKVSDLELFPFVEQTLDKRNSRRWYSALMDYGTYLKSVLPNPSQRSKHYTKQSRFIGSHRQVRGEIIKALTFRDQLTHQQLLDTMSGDITKLNDALQQLEKEGFITKKKTMYTLS